MTGQGWEHSAPGWLATMDEDGDATRQYVLDAPMLSALPASGRVLDIGCGEGGHWVKRDGERLHMAVDDMMLEQSYVTAWGDIRIENHHRPLSAYMAALLGQGLILRDFEDPPCTSPDPDLNTRFNRMPWAFFMAWEKPETDHEH